MRDLLNQTAEIAARYLETLDERSVTPTPEALARLDELNQPLQEQWATQDEDVDRSVTAILRAAKD